MVRRFIFQNKSVVISAQQVEGINYKFTYKVDDKVFHEFDKEINGSNSEMDDVVEHCKSMILQYL